MSSAPDPIELLIASAQSASDQQVAFYTEHLMQLVAAWIGHLSKRKVDRNAFLQQAVKSLMEDESNTREVLCYKSCVAVDMLARLQMTR